MTTARGYESNATIEEKEVTSMVGKFYYLHGLEYCRMNGMFEGAKSKG